jgi:nucleotide-binding universal stress UspA family protein
MSSALDPITVRSARRSAPPAGPDAASWSTLVVLAADRVEAGVIPIAAEVAARLGIDVEVRAMIDDGDAEVIRRSDRPLLVIGPRCRRGLTGTTALIAVDGSAGGATIVPIALDLAAGLGLEPRLVEVLLSPSSPGVLRRAQLAQLAQVVRAHEPADRRFEPLLLHGSRVDETLVELSGSAEVALLAMSTHGMGGPERLLVGSIALDVIRRAGCPVLVGPPHDALDGRF